jgi:prevent-host-death family protein
MPEVQQVNIYEAKTHFSKLCDQAASGNDVVIARHGQPWVRITTLERQKRKIRFGLMQDMPAIPDDFDEPMPDIQRLFEGEPG